MVLIFMKNGICRARLAALPLAAAVAFSCASSFAQNTDNAIALQPVVVTATRFPELVASLPFGVSVITAAEIQASGVTTVNEAIMKLLGVSGRLDPTGGNNYTLDLRGFGETASNNQVVIVDGLRLNQPQSVVPNLAQIPIESVQKIEVIYGSGAVLYGEGATGGVIVVTTKVGAGVDQTNAASAFLALGSNGLRDVALNATLVKDSFSLSLAAKQRKFDGHRDNFASLSDSVQATAQWANEWLRAGFRISRDELNSGLPGALTTQQFEANPRQTTKPQDMGKSMTDASGVFAAVTLETWRLDFDANQQKINQQADYLDYTDHSYDYQSKSGVDASNYSIRGRQSSSIGGIVNVLSLGSDVGSWTKTQSNAQIRAVSTSYFLKDEITFQPTDTRLTAGLRVDHVDRKDAVNAVLFSDQPRAWELGLNQTIVEGLNAFGRFGTSYRVPTFDDLGYTLSGVKLVTQNSRDQEIGLRWKGPASKVELRAYIHDLSNEIGFDSLISNPYVDLYDSNFDNPDQKGANVNFDSTRKRGVEIALTQAISSNASFRANISARESKFVAGANAGKSTPLSPEQTWSAYVDWRVLPGHTLTSGVLRVGTRYPDLANKCTMPAYTTLDLGYRYQLRDIELGLSVANATDEKYYTLAYGCVVTSVTSIYPEPGRTFTASARVKF